MPSVTRRSHGNRAKRRDEVRDRLLDVVQQLLAAGESYAEISVERLVSEAKLSRSTFYVYFEDKGDLLRAWFTQVIEELEDAAAGWWALDGAATYDDLRAALAEIVHAYRPHTALMAALYDISTYDVTAREEVGAMMGTNAAGLVRHIHRGQTEGWIDPELAAKETALWLMWMSERGLHQMVRGADDAEAELLITSYTDVIWHTLYAPARG
ncbi:MAG TPA: TetR/AcrR family transcriptional regulator [Solirubrobacteraceae bacterium]|jgi:AcrR family transcriptional regulator|nr:TetR/AcrR family transcriptional regulator [Solirubrobacteraceae bacterium]